MRSVRLDQPARLLTGTIGLPSSKSISNRLLIIRALSGQDFPIHNLSEADDTRLLLSALESNEKHISAGHAGTAMRFLAAYFALQKKEIVLDGSERMRKRPIRPLVDALRSLGADIRYGIEDGFPPLHIFPAEMKGGEVEIDASVSSQYISALMMIGSALPGGLELQLTGEAVSGPYIEMTARLMKEFGAEVRRSGNLLEIREQSYHPREYTVEGDWSAAAFWYEWMALSAPGSELLLEGLRSSGLQGDEATAEMFRLFGVETETLENGIRIRRKEQELPQEVSINLVDCPDLAPALAATLAGLKIKGKLSGLQTLVLKESNRIEALKTELQKTGAIIETGPDYLQFTGFSSPASGMIEMATYDDHRMAMAMAPLVSVLSEIVIADPGVVSKSYPGFWKNAEKYCTITR